MQAKDFMQRGHAALSQNRVADAKLVFEQALEADFNCIEAHYALVKLRFPGENYYELLTRMHTLLRPRTYIEVGVAGGASMMRVLPGTQCIGIDPAPNPDPKLSHVRLFPLRSDEFFATHDLHALFGGLPLDLGLIDGMHLFENTLQDFMNLERYCTAGSTLLIHDCLPFNELTSARERKTLFWTGDVWRIFPVLARFRPDLSLTVVGCTPSGLGIVRGLNPTSDTLAKRHQEALDFGLSLDFLVTQDLGSRGINVISNDWAEVSRVFEG